MGKKAYTKNLKKGNKQGIESGEEIGLSRQTANLPELLLTLR